MKFKMNNREWVILEKTQEELQKEIGKEDGYFYGLTFYRTHEIWLYKDLCEAQKRQTLMHELMHCYIGSYITLMDDIIKYEEDLLCDISSNSHDIIHEIAEKYFKIDKN